MDRPIHPDIEHLGFLLGTWIGEGQGEYPTIAPFGYRETVTFTHLGKPFVAYTQRTVATDDGRPLHGEAGYLRSPRPGWVELVVAHPTGVVEVDEGSLSGSSLRLHSRLVAVTGNAKEVTTIERDFDFEPGVIRYSLRMAAVGQPLTHHLQARLQLEV
jgi:THAP4-like, heme-binding beta-barrel domain